MVSSGFSANGRMKWCSWIYGSRLKETRWSLLFTPNQWRFICTSLPTRAMPQEYCQASCLGTYSESTSYALELVTSLEKSSSSSTVSGIVGIKWPSSPHSFNKQWTTPRPGLSAMHRARSSLREVKEGRRTASTCLSPPPVPPRQPIVKNNPEALARTCCTPQGSTAIQKSDQRSRL